VACTDRSKKNLSKEETLVASTEALFTSSAGLFTSYTGGNAHPTETIA